MADIATYKPINGGTTLTTDFKNLLSIYKTRTLAFFMFAFVAVTFFLAFTPSSNPSSPWFTNIFPASSNTSSANSYGSQFSSLFNYSSSNTTSSSPQQQQGPRFTSSPNMTAPQLVSPREELPSVKNTNKNINSNQSSAVYANQTTVSPPAVNNNQISTSDLGEKKENSDKPQVLKANQTTIITEKAPLIANQSTNPFENLVESLMNCDLFDGQWVKDNSYPLYEPGSCSFIDHQFSCITQGRPDKDYQKLKWKPKSCILPRLNAGHMLELLRGKRLVFVGDSLNRNMWESLACILRGAAKNPKYVYEAHGRHYFRGFVFEDYNCTLEFFASPFLVRKSQMPDKNGGKMETLRLDLIGKLSDAYKSADILIFNTGHWWTHEKTSAGKDYYQVGSHVYHELNVLEAFRKALKTWARWVDANVNPMKSMVFFRGYSDTHFRGGQWNSGGACDNEIEPIKNETYLTPYPSKMLALEAVLKGMKTHVTYLNITKLTAFRKDGHPSIYRKRLKQHMSAEERTETLKHQDCSHWCLPGVPDSWNELLYAELLVKETKMRQHQQRRT